MVRTASAEIEKTEEPKGGLRSFDLTIYLWITIGAIATFGIPLSFSTVASPAFVSGISATFVIAASAWLFRVDVRLFFLYWINLVILQNAASGLWYVRHSGDIPLMVTEAKSLALVVGVLMAARPILDIVKSNLLILVGTSLYLFAIVWNLRDFDSIAQANLRNFVIPLCTILLAASQADRLSVSARDRFIRVMLMLCAFWLAVGTFGELLITTPEWRSLFAADENGALNALSTQTVLFGVIFDRVGGILVEPVNTGYLAASVIIVLMVRRYFMKVKDSYLYFYLVLTPSAVALFFTSAKNPLLMFAVTLVAAVLLAKTWLPAWLVMVISWATSMAVTLGYIVSVRGPEYLTTVWTNPLGSIGNVAGESTTVHMAGMVAGFSRMWDTPLGNGIGSGGNFRRVIDPGTPWADSLLSGAESGWGTLAFQLGLAGIVGYAFILFALSSMFGKATTLLLAVWAAAAMFTEAFFGPTASSVLLLSAGIMATITVDRIQPHGRSYFTEIGGEAWHRPRGVLNT